MTTWLPYRKGSSPAGLIQTCCRCQRYSSSILPVYYAAGSRVDPCVVPRSLWSLGSLCSSLRPSVNLTLPPLPLSAPSCPRVPLDLLLRGGSAVRRPEIRAITRHQPYLRSRTCSLTPESPLYDLRFLHPSSKSTAQLGMVLLPFSCLILALRLTPSPPFAPGSASCQASEKRQNQDAPCTSHTWPANPNM